jgi:hypothetical protein
LVERGSVERELIGTYRPDLSVANGARMIVSWDGVGLAKRFFGGHF